MVCGDDIYFDNDNVVESEDIELYRYNGIPKNGSIYRNMVIKHSPNIIDLIEVGDYVNGFEVLYDCKETDKEMCNGEYRKCIIVATGKTGEWKMVDWDIESIVTREQFENMKYVVGDK